MTFGRVKISKADAIVSLYVRTRDNWTCQRCGKYDPPTDYEKSALQNSHYFGRTKKSVRFDEENCDTLCFGCHRIWEKEDREAYRDFKINQLGQKTFDLLTARANTLQTTTLDEKMIIKYYTQKLAELKEQMTY